MTAPRLTRIEIQGFRSFGKVRQVIDLPQSISVFWGGNSQGKTSFAEALEFLLTGQIARRELSASAKDEFAEALRNAHLDPAMPVVVEANILCGSGETRKLTRTLAVDYGRAGATGCTSHLQIDGKPCAETDLETKLGLKLSHPPLRAPVLSQHTLNYVFSASPTERATYFRAVLDTQDLENFRTAVAALQLKLVRPIFPELDDLVTVEDIPAIAATVGQIRSAATVTNLRKHVLTNISALLTDIGIAPESTLEQQADQIEKELERRQAQTFPLAMLGRASPTSWGGPASNFVGIVDAFISERAKTDAETQRLVGLFRAALALPDHPRDHDPRNCPLCGAVDTFTFERVAFIRDKVKSTETYATGAAAFLAAIRLVDTQLDALARSAAQAQPRFMSMNAAGRRKVGFRTDTVNRLVSDTPAVTAWLTAAQHLWRAARNLDRKIKHTRFGLSTALSDPEQWDDKVGLEASLELVLQTQRQLDAAWHAYESPAKVLNDLLRAAVDQSTHTEGWESLVRISRDPAALWNTLSAVAAHIAKEKALEKALNEIDIANGKVLDEKFADLSSGVKKWWDKLRPDEPTFFTAVQRRSDRARRNIDLKVGLSAKDDRSDAKFRDAVAVLSHSQLHCLGLSLFLARSVQEKVGFVVLDDPVLTSDDDYRPNFASSVMEGLLDDGLQVIICTQDHASWKDIGHRWGHRGAALFQIVRMDPLLGTEIRNQNDDLAAMIARAQPFVKSQDPSMRKEGAGRLREAIERFCKIMLVKERQGKGDSLASITDYDGKNFGSYGQQVMNLLIKDPSHSGKLKAAHVYVTPGPHDDKPPSAGELSAAYGDLKKLKMDYLN